MVWEKKTYVFSGMRLSIGGRLTPEEGEGEGEEGRERRREEGERESGEEGGEREIKD